MLDVIWSHNPFFTLVLHFDFCFLIQKLAIKTNAGKPRKKSKIVDSIKLKVNAKMEDVTVKIENDVRAIAALEVRKK